jgi:hypothetical protein
LVGNSTFEAPPGAAQSPISTDAGARMRAISSLAVAAVALALSGMAVAQDKFAAKTAAKVPTKSAAAPLPSVPTLGVANAEQLLAMSQAYLGPYDCEFKQTLSVAKHQVDGYLVVTFSSRAYTMKPVRSSTGAVRLEEVDGGPMLLVQIPAKSMLMDTVKGRRVVDSCVNEVQAKETATENNALGMNLSGQVDTSTSAPAAKK